MKELIKNNNRFEIVESGKVVYSTESGPEMVQYITDHHGITVYIRNNEAWDKAPSSVNVKEPT